MTKAERKKDIEEGWLGWYECDECRIEIGNAVWRNAHVIAADYHVITFRDKDGYLWKSNERYTLVVSREINEDDEEGN